MRRVAKLFRTTAFKLSAAWLVVLTLVAGGTILYVAWQTKNLLNGQIRGEVEAETTTLLQHYRRGGPFRLIEAVRRRTARRPEQMVYLVTSFTGDPVAGSIGALPVGALDESRVTELPYRRFGDDSDAPPRRALFRVAVLANGFRVVVGRDTDARDRFLEIVRDAALSSLGLLVVLGLAGGLVVGRRVLRRIDDVSESSRAIMAGDLTGRIPVTGSGDEFDRLALSLNAMLERISELMRGLQDVSENIAHELKTPLTRLRNRAEAAQRGEVSPAAHAALSEIIEESQTLIRTFEALLMIARAEAGQGGDQMGAIDLSAIAEDFAELYEPVAEEAGLALVSEVESGLVIQGGRELIGQAIANLIENAIRYGRPENGGAPTVTLGARRTSKGVEITVADHGPGVPEADRVRVLQRFVRLEATRAQPGSGLGLSLVAAVAHLHGGALRLEDNKPGLRAVLSL